MHMAALEAKLEQVMAVKDNVKYCMTNDLSKQSISCTLELLFSLFSESSGVIISCQDKITSEIEAKGYIL